MEAEQIFVDRLVQLGPCNAAAVASAFLAAKPLDGLKQYVERFTSAVTAAIQLSSNRDVYQAVLGCKSPFFCSFQCP